MGKKILVIDDDDQLCRLMQIRLGSEGYDVITAVDGKQGFQTAETQRPDLIILDALMPNMDGMEFSQELKKRDQFKNTPIILLSGLVHVEGKSGQPDPINLYVSKPFDGDQLIGHVKRLLAPF